MADQEKQEYPKMLYSMGEGNVLKNCVVNSEEEHKALGKEWREEPPKPRGRPKAGNDDDGA